MTTCEIRIGPTDVKRRGCFAADLCSLQHMPETATSTEEASLSMPRASHAPLSVKLLGLFGCETDTRGYPWICIYIYIYVYIYDYIYV